MRTVERYVMAETLIANGHPAITGEVVMNSFAGMSCKEVLFDFLNKAEILNPSFASLGRFDLRGHAAALCYIDGKWVDCVLNVSQGTGKECGDRHHRIYWKDCFIRERWDRSGTTPVIYIKRGLTNCCSVVGKFLILNLYLLVGDTK